MRFDAAVSISCEESSSSLRRHPNRDEIVSYAQSRCSNAVINRSMTGRKLFFCSKFLWLCSFHLRTSVTSVTKLIAWIKSDVALALSPLHEFCCSGFYAAFFLILLEAISLGLNKCPKWFNCRSSRVEIFFGNCLIIILLTKALIFQWFHQISAMIADYVMWLCCI